MPIREMGPDDIRSAYVLYIGAGAVAAGGIISLVRSLPTIWHGLLEGLHDFAAARAAARASLAATDRDLSMKFVVIGMPGARSAPSCSRRPLHMNLLGALPDRRASASSSSPCRRG